MHKLSFVVLHNRNGESEKSRDSVVQQAFTMAQGSHDECQADTLVTHRDRL
jgi:hypothetical protein